MVSAPAAVTDTAEGQVLVGDVHERVVDGNAAADGLRQHLVSRSCVGAKPVQRKWPRMGVDVGDGALKRVVCKHWQDGAKNFLRHEL